MKKVLTGMLVMVMAVTFFQSCRKEAGVKMQYQSGYKMEKVTFDSKGTNVVGSLFIPEGIRADKGAPAVTIIGPVAFVKEQSPLQYATRLAGKGYVTLIFDPRYHGESGGQPRRFESGKAKVEDLKASIDYLMSRPEVNLDKINILGICQGVNWAVDTSIADTRVAKLALVAGHYLTPELASMYLGGEAVVKERIERAKKAKESYENTGKVDYIPVASHKDVNALLKAKHIHDWYSPWGNRGVYWEYRGLWENRITQMSEAEIWSLNIEKVIENLYVPTLMVHADHAASGKDLPKALFKEIPTKEKKLAWLQKASQFEFYEDPVIVDITVGHINDWFMN